MPKPTLGVGVCPPPPPPLSVLHSSSPSSCLGVCGGHRPSFLRDRPQPEVATHVRSQLQWGKGYLEASRGSPGFQTYCFLSLLCKNSLHLLISYLCQHGDSLFLLLVLGQRRPHCPGSSRNLSCGRNLPGHPFKCPGPPPLQSPELWLGKHKVASRATPVASLYFNQEPRIFPMRTQN